MKPSLRHFLPIAVVAALFVVLAIGLRLDPRHVPSPLIGKPAPAFSLPDLDDPAQAVTPADFGGRPVMVNYFASWCAACRDEHPLFMKLAGEGVEIIGMAYKDQPEDTRQWLARHGNPYRRIVVDATGSAGLDWGVYGVPETYVLGADGTLLFKQVGPLSETVWREQVRPLMASEG